MNKFITVFKTTRPSFLILAPVCVLLGLSTSLSIVSSINLPSLFIVFAGAVSSHISVNMLNEYYDFKSGLDLKTQKTPFSGGSGSLPANPEATRLVFTFALFSLVVTLVIGIYLIFETGIQILPIGVIGIVLIVTYTQWLNRLPLICLVAPGLGFGTLMVIGTHVILTKEYSPIAWQVSFIPFFLGNNLLLLNQYPDIQADASVGRKTFPVAYGITKSNIAYAFFMLATYSLILFYIVKGILPVTAFIAMLPVLLSLFSLTGAIKHSEKLGEYPKYLAANVATTILTPSLLAISLLVS